MIWYRWVSCLFYVDAAISDAAAAVVYFSLSLVSKMDIILDFLGQLKNIFFLLSFFFRCKYEKQKRRTIEFIYIIQRKKKIHILILSSSSSTFQMRHFFIIFKRICSNSLYYIYIGKIAKKEKTKNTRAYPG